MRGNYELFWSFLSLDIAVQMSNITQIEPNKNLDNLVMHLYTKFQSYQSYWTETEL